MRFKMATCKIFIVGPHDESRYNQLAKLVQEAFDKAIEGGSAAYRALDIRAPTGNPTGDQFQDWILAQIDTASFVIADITDFNPNVIYEIAFAHAIGTPVVYFATHDATHRRDNFKVIHYLQYSLINLVSKYDLSKLNMPEFSTRLENIFRDGHVQSPNLLSRYYGDVPPIDAEFTRGLAQTYYNNFLGPLLTFNGDVSGLPAKLLVVIPDTLEIPARDVGAEFSRIVGTSPEEVKIAGNALQRPLSLKHSESHDMLFDIPSALFTLKSSRRYKKVANSTYSTPVDKDRITDTMTRKFVDEILRLRQESESLLGPLDAKFDICWMSEIAKDWTDEALINKRPLPRPKRAGSTVR